MKSKITKPPTLSMLGIAATLMLNACSSVPKPVVPDGATRVPANDATRISAIQQQVTQDRQLLTENNQLKAQMDALRVQVDEMRNIVRDALTLPPPSNKMPPSSVSPISPQSQASPILQSAKRIEVKPSPAASTPETNIALSALSYQTNKSGIVIRVFHRYAQTDFLPSEPVAQLLRDNAPSAPAVVVQGMTDSNIVNPVDRLIAIERAMKARQWLVDNGVNAARIRARFFSAGNFLSDNSTEQGRALNRRVEVQLKTLADETRIRKSASSLSDQGDAS
jgi:OmpA family